MDTQFLDTTPTRTLSRITLPQVKALRVAVAAAAVATTRPPTGPTLHLLILLEMADRHRAMETPDRPRALRTAGRLPQTTRAARAAVTRRAQVQAVLRRVVLAAQRPPTQETHPQAVRPLEISPPAAARPLAMGRLGHQAAAAGGPAHPLNALTRAPPRSKSSRPSVATVAEALSFKRLIL